MYECSLCPLMLSLRCWVGYISRSAQAAASVCACVCVSPSSRGRCSSICVHSLSFPSRLVCVPAALPSVVADARRVLDVRVLPLWLTRRWWGCFSAVSTVPQFGGKGVPVPSLGVPSFRRVCSVQILLVSLCPYRFCFSFQVFVEVLLQPCSHFLAKGQGVGRVAVIHARAPSVIFSAR